MLSENRFETLATGLSGLACPVHERFNSRCEPCRVGPPLSLRDMIKGEVSEV